MPVQGFFEAWQEGLKNLVPLSVEAHKMKRRNQELATQRQREDAQIVLENKKWQATFDAKQKENRVKTLLKLSEGYQESGDQNALAVIDAAIKEEGLPGLPMNIDVSGSGYVSPGTPLFWTKPTEEEKMLQEVNKAGMIESEKAKHRKPEKSLERLEEEQKIKARHRKPDKPTDFENAYQQRKNKNLTRGEFKRQVWDKDKTPRKELTPSEKETRIQHHIRSYGAPRNIMGQIQMLDPEQRKPRLIGWVRARGIEKTLSADELDRAEQAIMTELNIDIPLQASIRNARMAGATSKELEEIITLYQGVQ